ncbi:MAG TPA: glycosyltransferase family 1 protein [Candidatus Portnoybacteria bacterium]|nr:glycosyltransferase family 1 protein [Candidatus Portnoybacteria bacterium]
MIIGIDLRVLAKGTRSGIEEYTINLLSRLLSLDKNIKFKLFYNAFNQVELDYDWLKLPNVELKKFYIPNRFIFDPLAKFFRWPKVDQLLGGCDVFFAPHFLLSPVSKDCKKVITFHDLSFEYFPEFFSWRKRFWHSFLAPRQRALEADKIIAVSGSTKEDLADIYGAALEKIKTIHSGVGEEFRPMEQEACFAVSKKYGLPAKFILYFGTLEPRKNLVGLIKSYEILREKIPQGSPAPALVLAGSAGWLADEIFNAARKSLFAPDIKLIGFVDPEDKPQLFNLASVFVYPSFFEGFGFPPLEAMACGVPTITSHTSSFPEVVGDSALMVDPYNFEEIAWAVKEVWQDDNLKKELIMEGLERVKDFSWDKCAQETLDFLIK